MRTWILAIAVFLFVTVSALMMSWFAQASQAKKSVEYLIEVAKKHQIFIRYDAIETTGFPATLTVSLVNPHLSGNIEEIAKTFAPDAKMALPWHQETAINGTISLGINALSERYTLSMTGSAQSKITIGDKIFMPSFQPNGTNHCVMEMDYGGLIGTLWNFSTITSISNPFEKLTLLDCVAPAFHTRNSSTDELMFSGGDSRAYITHELKGQRRHFRSFMKLADFEMHPAGDALGDAMQRALGSNHFFSQYSTQYGKQNIDVDFSYDGPSDIKKGLDNAPLDIALSTFKMSNALYNTDIGGRLRLDNSGDKRSGVVQLKATSTFSERYDTVLQETMREAITQLHLKPTSPTERLDQWIKSHTPEETTNILLPALPNLHALGTLTQHIDATYSGEKHSLTGEATVSALELSASAYGITGKGSIKRAANALAPIIDWQVECRHCLRMIDDMAAYGNRLAKALNQMALEKAPITIDTVWAENMKKFLAAIALPADQTVPDTTLRFTIQGNEQSSIRVSGKPLADVMVLYQQHLAADRPTPGAAIPVPRLLPAQ